MFQKAEIGADGSVNLIGNPESFYGPYTGANSYEKTDAMSIQLVISDYIIKLGKSPVLSCVIDLTDLFFN